MNQQTCALSLGTLFVVIGLAGFVPAFLIVPTEPVQGGLPTADTLPAYAVGFGYLFGLFPTNVVHNLVHLTVGLFGLAASVDSAKARFYNQSFAILYILIAAMGLIPLSKTTFGTMPIFGNNVWFNALTAAIAGYYGFFQPERQATGSKV